MRHSSMRAEKDTLDCGNRRPRIAECHSAADECSTFVIDGRIGRLTTQSSVVPRWMLARFVPISI